MFRIANRTFRVAASLNALPNAILNRLAGGGTEDSTHELYAS